MTVKLSKATGIIFGQKLILKRKTAGLKITEEK